MAKSTDNAPITNEPELTKDQGTKNVSLDEKPMKTGLDVGLGPNSPTDKDGNFKGDGVQEKTPVAPTETRNAAKAENKIEEQSVEKLHKKFPASDIGPKTVEPYAPVEGLPNGNKPMDVS